MTRVPAVVVSGLIGVGLGALSGRILFGGSAWNLIPWTIVAVAIGLMTQGRRTALLASGMYGYLLCVVFLYVANTSNTPVAQRILFALVLGLVGPFCSIIVTIITRLISLRIRRRTGGGRRAEL